MALCNLCIKHSPDGSFRLVVLKWRFAFSLNSPTRLPCYSAFHRVPCWTRYCTFCTQRPWPWSWHHLQLPLALMTSTPDVDILTFPRPWPWRRDLTALKWLNAVRSSDQFLCCDLDPSLNCWPFDLGLDGDLVVGLRLSVKHVCRAHDSRVSFHLESWQ